MLGFGAISSRAISDTVIGDGPLIVNALNQNTDTLGGTFTSKALASRTYTNGVRYLIHIATQNQGSVTPNQPSLSGASLTFNLVATNIYDNALGFRRRHTVWEFVGNGNTGSITADFSGQTQDNISAQIDYITNADVNGSSVVQTAVAKDETGTVNNITATLSGSITAGNLLVAYGSVSNNGTNITLAITSGYTQLNTLVSPNTTVPTNTTAYKTTGNSGTATASANEEIGLILVEIKMQSVGGDSINPTDLTANRIYQRNGTSANIVFSGTNSGPTPNNVQVQLYEDDGTTVAQSWTTLTSATITSTTFTGTLNVPQGGMYRFAVRSRDSGGTVLATSGVTTNLWGVGAIFITFGSSTPTKWFDSSSGTGLTANADTRLYNASDAWTTYGTTGGIITVSNALNSALGIPIGFMLCGVSGTQLVDWSDNTDPLWTELVSDISNVGGKLEGAIIHVGSNDANNGIIASKASHRAMWDTMLSNLRTETAQSALPVFIWACSGQSTTNPEQQYDWARQVEKELALVANNYLGATTYELQIDVDEIHLTPSGYIAGLARLQLALLDILGSGTYHRPAFISGFVASGTSGTVSITHIGGTDISVASNHGFTAADGSGALSISSAVRTNATTITLTFGRTIVAPVTLNYGFGARPFAAGEGVRDNSTLGLPLEITTITSVLLVSSTYSSAFSVNNYVSATYSSSYAVANYANANYTYQYSVSNYANQTYSSAYSINNFVFGTYNSAFAVFNNVSQEFTYSFEVLNLGYATGLYESSFEVRSFVSATKDFAFSVNGYASQVYSSAYSISNFVNSSYASGFEVRAYASATYSTSFEVRNYVSATYASAFEVLSLSLVGRTVAFSYRVNNYVSGSYSSSFEVGLDEEQILSPAYRAKGDRNRISPRRQSVSFASFIDDEEPKPIRIKVSKPAVQDQVNIVSLLTKSLPTTIDVEIADLAKAKLAVATEQRLKAEKMLDQKLAETKRNKQIEADRLAEIERQEEEMILQMLFEMM